MRKMTLACFITVLAAANLLAADKVVAKKDVKAKTNVKTVTPQKLDCSNPQAIRNFKDIVTGKLTGTDAKGVETANDWARSLCGQKADAAGLNSPLPPNPSAVPSSPSCRNDVPREQCAREIAAKYFKPNLPISDEQALTLGRFVWEVPTPPAKDANTTTGK